MSSMKCARKDCLCIVDTDKAYEKNEHYYCSENCADPNGAGCGHKGCSCSGK